MAIDPRLLLTPSEYPIWVQGLVVDLKDVGGGVERVRRWEYHGPVSAPDDYCVRFVSGSDGHSARLLAGVVEKKYGWFWMKYFVWPALLAQGFGGSKDDE